MTNPRITDADLAAIDKRKTRTGATTINIYDAIVMDLIDLRAAVREHREAAMVFALVRTNSNGARFDRAEKALYALLPEDAK